MKKTSKRNVEQVVRSLLNQHGIDSPPIPVERLVTELDVQFHSQQLPDLALFGFYLQKNANFKRPLIFINSSLPPNIQRSTVAHEIGHLLWARKEVHVDRRERANSRKANVQTRDPEDIKADQFAAELLMPRYMLKAELEGKKIAPGDDKALVRLAAKYRVSLVAMILRLEQLGLLTSRF